MLKVSYNSKVQPLVGLCWVENTSKNTVELDITLTESKFYCRVEYSNTVLFQLLRSMYDYLSHGIMSRSNVVALDLVFNTLESHNIRRVTTFEQLTKSTYLLESTKDVTVKGAKSSEGSYLRFSNTDDDGGLVEETLYVLSDRYKIGKAYSEGVSYCTLRVTVSGLLDKGGVCINLRAPHDSKLGRANRSNKLAYIKMAVDKINSSIIGASSMSEIVSINDVVSSLGRDLSEFKNVYINHVY